MISIKCNNDETVDLEFLSKFTKRTAEELNALAAPIAHVRAIAEYTTHHAVKETAPPAGPMTLKSTIASSFEDKWDVDFFTQLLVTETDPHLIKFQQTVDNFGMDTLLKKTSLVIAINIVARVGMEPEALATEFTRLAAA
jgi:hypothetical protein